VELLISPTSTRSFIDILIAGGFQEEADVNGNDAVDFSDIPPFIDLLIAQ